MIKNEKRNFGRVVSTYIRTQLYRGRDLSQSLCMSSWNQGSIEIQTMWAG